METKTESEAMFEGWPGPLHDLLPALPPLSRRSWEEEYAYTLGVQAYIYGFPWIYLSQLRWLWTTEAGKALAKAKGKVIPWAPLNTFYNARTLARAIVLNLTDWQINRKLCHLTENQKGLRLVRLSAGRSTISTRPRCSALLSALSLASSPMNASTNRAPTLTDQIGGLRLVWITLTSLASLMAPHFIFTALSLQSGPHSSSLQLWLGHAMP
jgi:hypothetical protein